MISSEELVKRHQEKCRYANIGDEEYSVQMKHEDVDQSFLQSRQLEFVQRNLRKRIQEEKIDKLGSLCVGEYDAKSSRIIVHTVKGRVWSHFGYTDEGVMKFYPEEALFLMDVGTLRVYLHGVPLSLQEAAHSFFKRESIVTIDHYLVYNDLNRLGYIVRRKTESYGVKPQTLNHGVKRKQTQSQTDNAAKSSKPREYDSESSSKEGKLTVAANSCEQTISDNDSTSSTDEMLDPNNMHSTVKYTKFDYSGIEIFSTHGMEPMDGEMVHIDTDSTVRPRTNNQQFHYFSSMDYRDTKRLSSAETWQEFKKDHQSRLLAGPDLTVVPEDQHTPLVSEVPMLRNDISELLDKLKLSKTANLQPNARTTSDVNSLMFDVHQPNPNFRKANPPLPHHRVLISRPDSSPPSLSDLVALQSDCDSVPVHYAICDNGDVSFYSYTQECIPPDLYKPSRSKRTRRRQQQESQIS